MQKNFPIIFGKHYGNYISFFSINEGKCIAAYYDEIELKKKLPKPKFNLRVLEGDIMDFNKIREKYLLY